MPTHVFIAVKEILAFLTWLILISLHGPQLLLRER